MTGIRFRVIRNDKKLFDTPPLEIQFPKRSLDDAEFIKKTYDKLKKEHPKAQIIVICENILWETYEPMTELLPDDIMGLLKKMHNTMKEGIL